MMRRSEQPCSRDESSFDLVFVEETNAEDELDGALTFGGGGSSVTCPVHPRHNEREDARRNPFCDS